MNSHWIKHNTLANVVFPQLSSFCGIASCCGAVNAMIESEYTQAELHRIYGIGAYTKLNLGPTDNLSNLAGRERSGRGFSNWDCIRLFNAILLQNERSPDATILCGREFFRESGSASWPVLLEWLKEDSHQAIVHVENHYALFAGLVHSSTCQQIVLANSACSKGPVSSLSLAHLRQLAYTDERYGFILLADTPIPQDMFSSLTEAMRPRESTMKLVFKELQRPL